MVTINYEFFPSPCMAQGKLDAVEETLSRVSIKDAINIAYLFSPDFLLIKDYIFVADFFSRWGKKTYSYEEHLKKVNRLEKQFDGDSKKIEQMINSWSIVDFFCSHNAETPISDKDIETLCEALVYCWKLRVTELFPSKSIIIESGYEIMGELGLTITLYQNR